MAESNIDGIRGVIRVVPFTVQFVGSIFLGFGYRLLTVACAWEILQLTDSAYWVGLMTAAALLPVPLLSLFAGTVADRLNRRLLVILSTSLMTTMATAMTIAVALDVHTPMLLIALSIGMGVGIAFFDPSWLASIPDLVPKVLLPHAVTFNSAGNAVVWSAGTAAAGILVATSGVAHVLAIASAGYGSMTLAALVSGRGFERYASASSIVVEMLTGVRHIWYRPALTALLAIIGLFALVGSSLQTLLPVLSVEVLDGSSGTFGLLLGCFGSGSVLGLVTRKLASHWFGEKMVPLAILLFGFAGVAIGLSAGLLTISALLVVAGVTWTWVYATISAAIQLLTPSWVQARVMSVYTIAVLGSMSLGSLVAGAIAGLAGPQVAILVCSLGAVVLSVPASWLSLPRVEDLQPSRMAGWQPAGTRPRWAGRRRRVMIVTTWTIDPAHEDTFISLMRQVRSARMGSGVSRYTLYRDTVDPSRYCAAVVVDDWDQYQQITRRTTIDVAAAIERGRRLDTNGGPQQTCFVEVDMGNGHRWGRSRRRAWHTGSESLR